MMKRDLMVGTEALRTVWDRKTENDGPIRTGIWGAGKRTTGMVDTELGHSARHLLY